jgi:predicted AlkP superfamily phosphohydrolase/phosphomutase
VTSGSIRRKALIVGFDGGTWDVIDPLLARGELPNVARIVERGARTHLRSTIPPVTAAAWPTIVTGMNPGQHGLFRFEAIDHESYDHERGFVSSERLQGRTIFDYVGATGARVLAASVPMTYPAWPINGRMVSGFPLPRRDIFYTHPPEWAEELSQRLKFDRRVDPTREKMDLRAPIEFIRDQEKQLTQSGSYMGEVLQREEFGLAMMVTSKTDTAQHRYLRFR